MVLCLCLFFFFPYCLMGPPSLSFCVTRVPRSSPPFAHSRTIPGNAPLLSLPVTSSFFSFVLSSAICRPISARLTNFHLRVPPVFLPPSKVAHSDLRLFFLNNHLPSLSQMCCLSGHCFSNSSFAVTSLFLGLRFLLTADPPFVKSLACPFS